MSEDLRLGGIAILDYGSQYTQLIARRLREMGVYAEVFAYDAAPEHINQHHPRGYVLSGGPNSVYEAGAPPLPRHILDSGLPVLGICYGLQLLMHTLGGAVLPSTTDREFGPATIIHTTPSPLLDGLPEQMPVWMSHGDKVTTLAAGFVALAYSDGSPYAVVGDPTRRYYGVQFHPEVRHTAYGTEMLHAFATRICGCAPRWTPVAFIDSAVEAIRRQVGAEQVILGLSGGVDSAVAGALIHRAVGDQLTSIFVNTGMLRLHEPEQVLQVFREQQGMRVIYADATEQFLDALQGVTEPEAKRKIIGRLFIDVFKEQADQLKGVRFLAQGTIYPDVIESAKGSKAAHVIKSHHNVGGLPEQLGFELVEPLRDLFKDEVRKVGTALGLPDHIVWRQPFPGPGLAIRCLGDLTLPRLDKLRHADAIFLEELQKAGLLIGDTAQCFAVLLPVKAVGVMGDLRTYEEVIVLRAVQTDDFMTADWARLPYDLLAQVSRRIVNEVTGVNRVAYDITSKPPGTIEWE
ncbi:glutamine-hydrolyzing GMP synthase [Aggregatilineales bacterium SYSU G02658]